MKKKSATTAVLTMDDALCKSHACEVDFSSKFCHQREVENKFPAGVTCHRQLRMQANKFAFFFVLVLQSKALN